MPSMTRYFICLCLLPIPACAKGLTAQQVLDKVVATYINLKAVHMVAERAETTYPAGHAQTASTECELATATGGRYLARLKQPQQQALAVSDGASIWLALGSKKQWSRVSATPQAEDSDEEHDAKVASGDLHDSLENILLGRFLALGKTIQDPEIGKQRIFELGGANVRCFAIRGHTSGNEIELLIDEQRFVVLQYKETSRPDEAPVEIAVKLKRVELNQEVGDSLFHFEPDPAWTEVEAPAPTGNPVQVGGRAADFALRTLDGESVTLQSLRGKVTVIDFWATWCGPCRVEFPAFEKMRAEFGDDVRFYGVSDEPAATVKKFIEEYRYRMPMLIDGNREMHRHYGVHKIPVLLVIDQDSVVRQMFIGMQNESDLRDAIRSVVSATPQQP
jgi:peroxiredoxin/outer membrane lipoprotein-sorting protein